MKLHALALSGLLAMSSPAFALNILVTNDDGLTSNLKALYTALKAEGHDVIVSVPCSGQSGRGAGIVMYSTDTIVATNDSQITTENGCHNGAAAIGAPAVGAFTKTGYTGGDYNYVHGTPVMSAMYGVDVLAKARWGKAPDLVLSGPNEGQNVGHVVINSGTVSNVQFSAARGIPSIALSAGTDTVDDTGLANAKSTIVANQTVKLIKALQAKAGTSTVLLPTGLALNVNFPTGTTDSTAFAFSKIGSFDLYNFTFKNSVPYGLSYAVNSPTTITSTQTEDESYVSLTKIAVTAMQVSFDHRATGQQWLRLRLRDLFGQ